MPTVPTESVELNIEFPDPDQVSVSLGYERTRALAFVNPLTVKDRKDIQWYIETYGTHWSDAPDDVEAERIRTQLPVWGRALFNAVFSDRAAVRLFNRFQDSEEEARLITIRAVHPAILGLPWELLHDPGSNGEFLFHETPRISIRRSFSGATDGRPPFPIKPKERLHLLFVVSRPKGAGFLDPRADPCAVLDALDKHAPGRVTWEFLRPATLEGLRKRLDDRGRTRVDILHFDGHGVFDRNGGLPERTAEKDGANRFSFEHEHQRDRKAEPTEGSPPNTGYLLFEKSDGSPDLVPADKLSANLHRHNVPLVILSACQTAAMSDEDKPAKDKPKDGEPEQDEPMGSVAARLTATGIPAVLAMSYSVLVHTTRELFGEFYEGLALCRGTGESLDNARQHLFNDPRKYQVRRGKNFVWLQLHDWFLPALYQSGRDVPLLKQIKSGKEKSAPAAPRTNLPPEPEAGFFGRTHELWDIERWFAGKTRRITITGFGGQGKTALAQEAGRWLTRTGMFQAAVFVNYSVVQGRDAVAVAVSTIASVLGETLIDAKAVTAALKKTPTLVILDNLEALDPQPLRELLDAAKVWSEANGSRVLCTTRKGFFDHPDYAVEGTFIHRRIHLDGMTERDAVQWFAQLMMLPPDPTVPMPSRDELVALFLQVNFHPLSIRVLAQQLKTREPAELGPRLEQLLSSQRAVSTSSLDTDATIPELVASLLLSLDRLDEAARQVLPRLGVFHGGAFEDDLLAITEIGEETWPGLRQQLEAAALIEVEPVPAVNVPFLRFHPTLAPMLWEGLDAEERARLSAAHRSRYYALASSLFNSDVRKPQATRAIARLELPNLLHAVHATLDAADPDAVDFADRVNHLLNILGLKQESEELLAKMRAVAGQPGSQTWYIAAANDGQDLLSQGRGSEAAKIFRAMLVVLGDDPSFQRVACLVDLGRSLRADGRPDLAETNYREAIAVNSRLEQTDEVRRQRGVCLADLADALVDQGHYAEARKTYEAGLNLAEELGDLRMRYVALKDLENLAIREGRLDEGAERRRTALALFSQLQEPMIEAAALHQLGMVCQAERQWDEAERHYRESARITETLGETVGAAKTRNQLALVNQRAGKPQASEMWFQTEIDTRRRSRDRVGLRTSLHNCADLLRTVPGRLADARQMAEEALAIAHTLSPGVAEIWKTYGTLAKIAEKEAYEALDGNNKARRQDEAREYRRLARDARRNFAGTRHQLRQHAGMIIGAFLATQEEERRKALEAALPEIEKVRPHFVVAIRSLLAGERSADVLCESLDFDDSMIMEAILAGIADPDTLKDLIPDEEQE